jgi:hypothetical protein
VKPALVVHMVLVRSAREWSNFTPGKWVGMSAGHGPGIVVGAGHECKNI